MTAISTTCPATSSIDVAAREMPPKSTPRIKFRGQPAKHFQHTAQHQLSFQEFGAADGRVVFYFHDIGSSRLEGSLFNEAAASAGIRLIAVDRPGIGGSSFYKAGPQEFAVSVVALADHLGVEQFAALSLGGGSVYALQLARLAPHRLRKHVCLGGVPGSVFNENTSHSYLASCWNELTPVMIKLWVHMKHQFFPDTGPQDSMARLEQHLSWQDRQAIRQHAVRRLLKRDQLEALRAGCRGVAQEMANCYRKLDFRLQDVSVPTVIWQGETDQLSRRSDCEYLAARLPAAQLNVIAGAGHFFFLGKLGQVMSSLHGGESGCVAIAA